jgi:peptidoglycan/LPS O-acetylase OafA/YrhL
MTIAPSPQATRTTPDVQAPRGTPKHRFRPDIQGLRAVAVLLVLFDHLLDEPVGGFIGVDVFFVISGFLITSLLLKEGERKGAISLRGFYIRRIRRILPVAVVVLVATTLASYAVLLPSKASQALHDSFWAGGFLANWHFAQAGTDYFGQGSAPSPVQHYWSLSVEEQFYVVWPLALLVLYAAGRRLGFLTKRLSLGLLAGAITVGSFAYSVHLTQVAQTDAYFSTATRAWELSLGALVAVSQGALLRLPSVVRAAGAWLGLVGIGVASVVIDGDTAFPGSAAALPVLATGLVLASGNPLRGPGRTLVLDNPVVQYVGNVSYSLYLWHWPCIVLAAAYYGADTLKFYVAGGLLPLVLSVLSFHLLEDPIRRSLWLSPKPEGYRSPTVSRWYRDTKRGLDAALVSGAVLVFFLAGFLTNAKPTDPAELSAATTQVPSSAPGVTAPALTGQRAAVFAALNVRKWGTLHPSLDSLTHRPPGCVDVGPKNVTDCVYGDLTGSRTAVVLGDSIAAAWTPAVIEALGSGWKVQMLTMSECPAPDLATWRNRSSRNVAYRACTEHRAWALSTIASLKPDLVVTGSLPEFANRVVDVSGDARYTTWRDGTTKLLGELAPLATRVVVVGAPPNSGNLQTCVTRVSTPADCVGKANRHQKAVALAEQQATSAAGAGYVNPYDWFCFQDRCPAVIGDVPVMRDGTHTTPEYARVVAPLLRPALLGSIKAILPQT